MSLLQPTGGMLNESLVEAAVGLAVFGSAFALKSAFSGKAGLNARARTLMQRRSELRVIAPQPASSPRREKTIQSLKELLYRLKLTEGPDARKAADLLARAGWRAPEALVIFSGARLAMPILVGIVAWLMAPLLLHRAPGIIRILIGLIGVVAGAFGPAIYVKNAGQNRGQKIQKGLPDALDLFVICAEAGLGLDAAVTRVAREIARAAPELADELALTAVELSFLPDRRDALMNLHKRVPTPSIRNLVTTLVQTERYGTPLAQSLRVLAAEFRDTRMMKAEEKAARLPAILTVPMIALILPPLFVVLLGPAIIQILASLPK